LYLKPEFGAEFCAQALPHVDYLLTESPSDAELLDLKGRCEAGLRQDAKAVETFQKALAINPQRLETYLQLADVLMVRRGERDKARQVVDEMVKNNPKDAKAYTARGRYLMQAGSPDKAMDEMRKALELAPDDVETLVWAGQCGLQAARHAARQKKPEDVTKYLADAGQTLKHATEVKKDDWRAYSLLSRLHLSSGNPDEALKVLNQGVAETKQSPMYLELLWQAGKLSIDLEKEPSKPETQKIIKEMQTAKGPNALIQFLQSRVEIAQGRWRAARAILEAIRPDPAVIRNPELLSQVDFLIGECYSRGGDNEKALTAYRRVVDTDPAHWAARLRIVNLMKNKGQWDEAINDLQQAARRMGEEEAYVRLGAVLLERNQKPSERWEQRWDQMDQLLRDARAKMPDSQNLRMLQAEALAGRAAMERTRGLERSSKDLLEKSQSHFTEAEQVLQELRKKNPSTLDYWLRLASLAQQQEKWDEAEKYFSETQQRFSDQAFVPLQLARADYLVKRFKDDAALRLKELNQGSERIKKDADRVYFWFHLAQFLRRANDYESAKWFCEKAAEKDPHSPAVLALLVELTILTTEDNKTLVEKIDGVMERLDQAEKAVRSDDNQAQGLRVYVEAVKLNLQAKADDQESLAKALKCLEEARALLPRWPKIALLEAEIHVRQNKPLQALEDFNKAISLGERRPEIVLRTAALMCEQRRYSEALRLLRAQEDQKSPSSQMNRLYAELILHGGDDEWREDDFERVGRLLQNSVPLKSRDYADHLWRGRRLTELARRGKAANKGDAELKAIYAEAEKSLLLAIGLKTDSADSWSALVHLLVTAGRTADARKTIEQAAAQIAPLRSALALGTMWETVGDLEQARHFYKTALQADPTVAREVAEFYVRVQDWDSAEPLLAHIYEGKAKASPAEVLWARRATAAGYHDRGNFDQLQKAVALVEQNLAEAPSSLDDQRMKIRLLLKDGRPAKRREAIAALEGMGENKSLADCYQLAQIYLAQNEWKKYLQAFVDVMAKKPQPEQVASHISALLRRAAKAQEAQPGKPEPRQETQWELGEAATLLTNLGPAFNDQPRGVGLRAEILFRQQKFDALLTMLTSLYEGDKDPDPKGDAKERERRVTTRRLERMRLSAELLDQFVPRLAALRQQALADKFRQQADLLYIVFGNATEYELKGGVSADERKGIATRKMFQAAYLARKGQVQQSLGLIDNCWELSGDPALLAMTISSVFRAQGVQPEQVQHAEQVLQAGLKKHGPSVPLLSAMGQFCTVQGRYGDAERYYREILKKEPNHPVVLNNLAVLLALQQKNLDEALEAIEKALRIAGPMGQMLDSRATVYIMRGESEKALADLEVALADEASPVRLFHQARAYYIGGKKDEAKASLDEAAKTLKPTMLDPPERPVYKSLCQEFGIAGAAL
jgi:tetratricopeptide (TPR) repeat protein